MFDIAKIQAKAARLQPRSELSLPVIKIPDGAGIEGEQRLVVQVAFTFWQGRAYGAAANTQRNRAHRLEITRMLDLDAYAADETAEAWFRAALGKKNEDRVYRPGRRFSLVMEAGGPPGLTNLKPWTSLYKQVGQAILQTQDLVMANKSAQYGMILVVDVYDTHEVKSTNPRYSNYDEARVASILAAEVIKLNPTRPSFEDIVSLAGEDDPDADVYGDAEE